MIYSDKGYIGCFEMNDKDLGRRQLEEYVKQLTNAGHKRIIAPINGDTWHTYRLMNWSGDEPAFPFEPHNPLWYNDIYTEFGFKPLKTYRSDKFSIDVEPPLCTDTELSFRDYREGDLKLIYDISLHGFDANFLYDNITFEEFSRLYQPVLPMIDKELVVIAEIDNAPVGFMFSFAAGDRLILKTMAVLPEYRSRGIGAKMFHHILFTGQRKSLRTAIAALIAEGNNSHKIASKYGSEKIREYTLYYLDT
ncbi:MAG: GNAT family N-acetyltransferase [Tannerella sp.]|jgi:GNAT superfamily N-acetyltransferase|nr:GNAT family N-acetyltransferase [Tannerella sp.]